MGQQMSVEMAYYNVGCYPFMVAFLISLVGCSLYKFMTWRRYLATVAATLGSGAALAALSAPTPNPLANFAIPVMLAGLAAAVAKLGSHVKLARSLVGGDLVHVGLCLTLFGAVVSSMAVAYSGPHRFVLEEGCMIKVDGTVVRSSDCRIDPPSGLVFGLFGAMGKYTFMPERYTGSLSVSIAEGGMEYKSVMVLSFYQAYGIFFRPCIVRTPTYDLYVIPRYFETEREAYNFSLYLMGKSFLSAARLLGSEAVEQWGMNATWVERSFANVTGAITVSFKKVPLISLVWVGTAFMTVGGRWPW